ncbi:NB-ARC domain-containing protein [Streptomyces sp. LX-29]|uniref:AfsR/SARP family transcriptional regulator n=1 Tax=Streptomyces sp. LX-29 TaxID=2900152 RepID=UPI00240CE648|nr:AfsR/SARP family transcriptional regulator [Streptomyces sp. LX-29]WFB08545.1 NB-ARC domain-containing protein [Streptomyces sp. LX-29]
MEFGLLGPVAVATPGHGPLPLGPTKRRSVLAMLLLQPNTTVSVEQLIACLWEEEPPVHARTVIQGHVSQLRAALATGGAEAYGVELDTVGRAYRLRTPETLVDAHRFSELAALARPEDEPAHAIDLLREALSLWRGPALTGTVSSPPFAAAAHALEERRLAAVESLATAHVTLGEHDRAAAALAPQAAAHPLREGLVAALMLALYRIGRQSDAIDCYHRTRRMLADDLGVDPGERLRGAYEEIITGAPTRRPEPHGHPSGRPAPYGAPSPAGPGTGPGSGPGSGLGRPKDTTAPQQPGDTPAVSWGVGPAGGTEAAVPRPRWARPADPAASGGEAPATPAPQLLPRPPAGFLGRDAELAQLTRLALPEAECAEDSRVALVTGPAGVGKTALAVRWGHAHARAFPDGRLFADLRGFSAQESAEPAHILRDFLLTLGVAADRIPESVEAASALYRSLAAGRRLLVVLDNAGSSAQVRPLLPAGLNCVTLVTSRSRLDGLVATDSARSLRLHPLGPQDGVALLGAVLGPDRVAEDPAAAQELVALCNGLPLALRAAAAQLTARPRWRLARLAAALRDERQRLALLSAEDTGVAAALRASVARLSADDVRLLATLGTGFAREVDAAAVAAVAGADPERTRDALDRLAEMHLIDEEATNRYVMTDLVKLFAQDEEGPTEPREGDGRYR